MKKNKLLIVLLFLFIFIYVFSENSNSVTLIFTGDIMVHKTLLKMFHTNNKYDFNPIFINVKNILKKGDFVVGNLETTIPGKLYKHYSGYPSFRSPEILLEALKNAGFTYLNFCNNHVFDSMQKGFINTVKTIKRYSLGVIGAKINKSDSGGRIIRIKNFTFGVLSYTYDTNYKIKNRTNYINIINKKRIKKDIELIKKYEPNFIIVILHFGIEYKLKPTKTQISLAKFLFQNGVNFIIGMHPHVVEPYYFNKNYIYPKFVAFSLGNFLSAQNFGNTKIGEVLILNFKRDSENFWLDNYQFVGIKKHKVNGKYELIKISNFKAPTIDLN